MVEAGLRASKESMRPLDDRTSTAAIGGGTLTAGTTCMASMGKSAGSEKLFPESCLSLVGGGMSRLSPIELIRC